MRTPRRIRPSRQLRSIGNNAFNGLAAIASYPARTLAAICAAGLVVSSAGFGATYAWTTSSQNGIVLGACAVLMAIALESAKPLAVAGVFAALRSWAIVRAVLLTLLAVASIAFGLASELALIAGNRGDRVAERASIIAQNEARQARLWVAQSELASLAPSRAVAEIEADMAKLLADNLRAGDCRVMDGPVSRTVCPQFATLNGEIARTRRRAELLAVIAGLTDALPATMAIGTADPASSALSSYLGPLGAHVPASVIAEWLVLVPALALELGAALGAVLVEAIGAPQRTHATNETDGAARPTEPVRQPNKDKDVSGHTAEPLPGVRGRHPGRPATATKKRHARVSTTARARIRAAIKAGGGRIEQGTVRQIAPAGRCP